MLKDQEKQELKKLLLDERDRIEKELHSFTTETSDSPGGHETLMPSQEREVNPEDQASQEEQYFKLKSLENILEQRLIEVNRALEKIDEKNFGTCEKCGQEIPWQRLKVNPAAPTCISCAA
ncbi:MAG: coiled-coil [Parcubacteria group bacterium GW2011_GWC1_45_9]|nr:MAG: Transcriptional regulator, TraR/DksA family [Parcubacteria group bacterium GW2011_GWA1_Parcubacteria_45_10]KKT88714.1 MAG: Transcriptional regulator, TraR/DksA family [Parcubacteria group bacterium GW2011_GWB1_45_10]KKU17460.1 MAG: coiled-coil [Parcubacteria group bacterium GW2011_GWC1_45_9]